jgi:hypothetical protein
MMAAQSRRCCNRSRSVSDNGAPADSNNSRTTAISACGTTRHSDPGHSSVFCIVIVSAENKGRKRRLRSLRHHEDACFGPQFAPLSQADPGRNPKIPTGVCPPLLADEEELSEIKGRVPAYRPPERSSPLHT